MTNSKAENALRQKIREAVKVAKAQLLAQEFKRQQEVQSRKERTGGEDSGRSTKDSAKSVDPEVIESLVEQLGEVGSKEAKTVIAALVAHGEQVVPFMRRALHSRLQKLRRRAPRVLARLGAVEAVSDLVELLNDDVLRVEVHAVKALADLQLERPEFAEIFERYLIETNAMLVTHALRGLCLADPERALIQSCRLLSDPRSDVRLQAAIAYEAVSDSGLADIAAQLREDVNINIRMLGYNWLAQHDPSECLKLALNKFPSAEIDEMVLLARLLSRVLLQAQGKSPQWRNKGMLPCSSKEREDLLDQFKMHGAHIIELLEACLARELGREPAPRSTNAVQAVALFLYQVLEATGEYERFAS